MAYNLAIKDCISKDTPILYVESLAAKTLFTTHNKDGKHTFINGEKFYYKPFHIHELIGMYLASYLRLRSVRYFLV